MSNRFFAILLIIIAVIGGVIFVSKNKSDTPSVTDTPPSNITTGKGTTGVTLVEYGDFQCPVCASFFPIVQQVKEKYGDQITFQFRNFPLSEIHPNAVIAARAAMAANNQGKFWEYHDLLYQNQTSWAESNDPVSILDGYAEQLGLDMQQFRSDRASNEINNVVQADRAEAQRQGFTGTPTFVLDGQKLDPSPTSIDAFSAKIDEAIKAKQAQ